MEGRKFDVLNLLSNIKSFKIIDYINKRSFGEVNK